MGTSNSTGSKPKEANEFCLFFINTHFLKIVTTMLTSAAACKQFCLAVSEVFPLNTTLLWFFLVGNNYQVEAENPKLWPPDAKN